MKKNKTAATVRLPRETPDSRLLFFAWPVMLQGHPVQDNLPYPPASHLQLNRGVIATEAI